MSVRGRRVAFGLAVALTAGLGPVAAEPEAKPGIETLAFMAGCWQGELEGGSQIREIHGPPLGGVMLGSSHIVAGGSTRFFEFVRIVEQEGQVVYRPYPDGRATVSFELVRATATEAVFENPDHDFPQRIVYDGSRHGRLVARIEKIDGSRSRTLAMAAVPCGGERHRGAVAPP